MSTEAVPSPSRRKPPVRVAAIAVLALLVLAGFAAVSSRRKAAQTAAPAVHPAAAPKPAAVEVQVERVFARALSQPIRVTGTLRTDEVVTLSTKATGLVKRVLAKEGDRVRRGQLLVEVDDRDLRAQRDRAVATVRAGESQVKEAEAAVHAAEARLQQARTNRNIKNVGAGSDYRRAQQSVNTSRTRLSQAQSLAEIADTEAETRVASARSSLQAARERLKALQEGSRKQEKATAEAAVNRAQSQVARMKSMLGRREQLLRDGAIASEVVDNARRDFEAAQADLDAARQQLSLVLEGPRTEELRVGEETVRMAEAALRDAEAYRAKGKVSNEDVRAAESAVEQAQAGLEASKANLAQSQWNEDEIRSVQAALNQARATVSKAQSTANQARADVRYQDELISQTRVFSPINGVVTKRSVQAGAAVVQMRNELMTLVSEDTLYFEATAPESALPQLAQGLQARVQMDALPGRTFAGVVREIIPVAEGTNRSVRLRISFPRTAQGAAVVGGFARAEIQGRSRSPVISVPREAVVSDEGQTFVFVVDRGKAARRSVRVGEAGGDGDRVALIAGVRDGEQVVVDGAVSLGNGQLVTVKAGGSR
jgi:RND family efflux transporter MFP subunit